MHLQIVMFYVAMILSRVVLSLGNVSQTSQSQHITFIKCEIRKIIVTHSLVLISADKRRKDEAFYHPRLTYMGPEDEESEADFSDQHSQSDGSYSPRRSLLSCDGSSAEGSSPRRRPGPKKLNSVSPASPRKPEHSSERMFDDSDDDDSSTEKEGTNLNWTPADVTAHNAPIPTGTARRRSGPPGGKDPLSSTGSALINLCSTGPLVAGRTGVVPAEAHSATGHNTQQGE